MIEISNKKYCVGCRACEQRCPKTCIDMIPDEQGCIYPKVDISKCIDCHICEKVCPVLNQDSPRILNAYAVINPNNDIRSKSSSGGVFYHLANKILSEGGVVFGAGFNCEQMVEHRYTESNDALMGLLASKYVQSDTLHTFTETERFLKSGRKVLYSGTPCQIAGLKSFLRKDYGKQLLTVDIVCHGCPTPIVWRDYLEYITTCPHYLENLPKNFPKIDIHDITNISFRDKRLGWDKYGFSVRVKTAKSPYDTDGETGHIRQDTELLFEPHSENLYMKGFLADIYLRPSCYDCPSKEGKSYADITLADFWGIKNVLPDYYEKTGVSLVLINILDIGMLDGLRFKEVNYNDVIKYNPAIIKSPELHRTTQKFWKAYTNNGVDAILPAVMEKSRISLTQRIIKKLVRLSKQISR